MNVLCNINKNYVKKVVQVLKFKNQLYNSKNICKIQKLKSITNIKNIIYKMN